MGISCTACVWAHICPRDLTRSSSLQSGSPKCQPMAPDPPQDTEAPLPPARHPRMSPGHRGWGDSRRQDPDPPILPPLRGDQTPPYEATVTILQLPQARTAAAVRASGSLSNIQEGSGVLMPKVLGASAKEDLRADMGRTERDCMVV